MMTKYVSDIAQDMGIKLSKVSLVEGKTLGCRDTHLLMLSSKGCNDSTIIYQTDLDHLAHEGDKNRLDDRIRATLNRLQLMLEV
jgi:hypothetical protein